MNYPNSIALDGPAASGKSSVGKRISDKLGYLFLDTGIMYRAVTWRVLESKIDVFDEEKVGNLAKIIDIKIQKPSVEDGRLNDIFVDGNDVTWKLRSNEINENVSQISRYSVVRKAMTEQQREIGKAGKVVMAGRDIGTVVLPDAKVKIYLEASAEERAKRRYEEDISLGKKPSYVDILENVKMRDEIDSGREIAPLVAAEDAYIINTDSKSIDLVVDEIMEIISSNSIKN